VTDKHPKESSRHPARETARVGHPAYLRDGRGQRSSVTHVTSHWWVQFLHAMD